MSKAPQGLTGNGQYLTIMDYGINAATFNARPGLYSPSATNTALGQSGSVTGHGYTAVPRVVAVIDANGNVNSSTALYGVFDPNNPRSAYTANASTLSVSGQGTSGNATGARTLLQLIPRCRQGVPVSGVNYKRIKSYLPFAE